MTPATAWLVLAAVVAAGVGLLWLATHDPGPRQ